MSDNESRNQRAIHQSESTHRVVKRINDRLVGDTYRCFITESVAELHTTHTHTTHIIHTYVYIVIDDWGGGRASSGVCIGEQARAGWLARKNRASK